MAKEVEVLIKLFNISGKKDIKREYPELSTMDEFMHLNSNEVKFCWLVGNQTSPISGIIAKDRLTRALEIVWGKRYGKNPLIKEIVDAKSERDIPKRIMDGILKMGMFSPSVRLKAKLMSEYIFQTLNELIVVDEETRKGMDIDDRKKYADFVIKVSSELQDMVGRLENAYGVKTIERDTKQEIKVSINDIMY